MDALTPLSRQLLTEDSCDSRLRQKDSIRKKDKMAPVSSSSSSAPHSFASTSITACRFSPDHTIFCEEWSDEALGFVLKLRRKIIPVYDAIDEKEGNSVAQITLEVTRRLGDYSSIELLVFRSFGEFKKRGTFTYSSSIFIVSSLYSQLYALTTPSNSFVFEDVAGVRGHWKTKQGSLEPIMPSTRNTLFLESRKIGRLPTIGSEEKHEEGVKSNGWALLRAGLNRIRALFGRDS